MKRIFITGATGLLGSHLAAVLLAKGHSIRLSKRANSDTSAISKLAEIYSLSSRHLNEIEWVDCDLRRIHQVEKALEDVHVIFHCGAMVSFWRRQHEEMYDVNVNGTANLINAALDAGVEYFGHVSSIAALGRAESGAGISEDNQWTESKYNTAYAKTKYLSELEVWRGMAEGLNAGIINPGVILGEGNWDTGSLKIVKSAARGFPFYPAGKNGYVDVQDCVKALLLLWEQIVSGERFILVEGSYNLRDVLSKLAIEFGKKGPYIKVPSWLSVAAAHGIQFWSNVVSRREPFLSPETAANSDAEFIYENKKIKLLSGFNFNRMDGTISRIAKYYRAHQI